MTDAELHIALREVVGIGRRGGYDNDEIAERLARIVRDYANDFAVANLRELAADVDVCCKRMVEGRAAGLADLDPCKECHPELHRSQCWPNTRCVATEEN